MIPAGEAQPGAAGPPLRLTLDLDPGSDPVAGVLSYGGHAEAFVGWSGLSRAIELALEAQRPGRSTPRPAAPGGGGAN
jgi:hypothetical protein